MFLSVGIITGIAIISFVASAPYCVFVFLQLKEKIGASHSHTYLICVCVSSIVVRYDIIT